MPSQNGTITTASDEKNPDLFFALKGGLNRFGVVTSAEFYTHPQPSSVWGGFRIIPSRHTPEVLNAVQRFFDENQDPKAQIIMSLEGSSLGVDCFALLFYDGPEKPAIFDLFEGFSTIFNNVGTKSYRDFIRSFPTDMIMNMRGTFATLSTTALTTRFLEAIREETDVRHDFPCMQGPARATNPTDLFTYFRQLGKPLSLTAERQ